MNLKYILSTFFIFFIFLNSMFYFDFSHKLDNFYLSSNEKFESIENVIVQIHKEDSTLYKRLLIEEKTELENYEELISKEKSTKNIIIDLFTKEEFNLDNSFSSSLDFFFLLEKSREKIIDYHKLNLVSTQKNYNQNLNILLNNYDNLMIGTIENFNSNLNDIKKFQLEFKKNLKLNYLFKVNILNLILFIYFLFIYIKFNNNNNNNNNNNKKNFVIDSNMNKILLFIKSQNEKNLNPTIKEIKLELKLTHPTIISKLKILEKNNKIYFNKIGRNKYIFLR